MPFVGEIGRVVRRRISRRGVRRPRFTLNNRRVPRLFVPVVTFTFTKLATVFVEPEVVVPTVLVRVLARAVVVTVGLCTTVACRVRPTTLVLLLGNAIELSVISIIPSL